MTRHREHMMPLDLHTSIDWIYSSTDDDDITQTSPGDDVWKKFDLMTPPDSPAHELDDDCFEASSDAFDDSTDNWLTTPFCFERKAAALSSNLIQDCMWSGSDGEQARTSRIRKVSLSELTMLTTSTACVDPTSISSCTRAQNQMEHSYSLTTPEPLRVRVPAIMTPSSTDDSESEEDVIDVVTIDTKTQCSSTVPHVPSPSASSKTEKLQSSQYKVRHNLQAVANRLTRDSCKRPKCMTDQDFALPSKKARKYHSISSSMLSSQNSSDSEDFEGKRSQHNVMERQRRNDLKNSLLSLRSNLPSLTSQERAPKVVILSHATEFVRELKRADRHAANELHLLKYKNDALKQRLDYIQRKIGLNTQ